ncbi:MAG: sigma-54-dependent Fis family transcriptional regulator [Deltaproteobacteria bacterium]|nr:sigma-54-dependent Fis family transcriptional regulator [Deltaproteobacteria bacterium]
MAIIERRREDRTFKSFKNILVIDDEPNMRHVLSIILKKAGYTVTTAPEGREGLALFEEGDFDAILCDIRMPAMDGIDFLKSAIGRRAEAIVVMMSAYGTVDTAVEAMKLGAADYISKPFKPDEILVKLRQTEEKIQLRHENALLRDAVRETFGFENIVAKSKAMRDIFKTVQKIAEHKTTVLITGESGTGKELIAKAIHYNGIRKNAPLVALNCGGVPEHILESELFGHVKGAFTDAIRDKKGLFEEASGGTLFLDEIGELSMSLQVKLLRALQEEEIRPLGSNKSIKVDIRVLAATAKDLSEEVKNNAFRDDLYYRINVLPIVLPPLRKRKEDIPLLVEHFIRKFNLRLNKTVRGIHPNAIQTLMERTWRGNVRELENVIERTMVMMDHDSINIEDLPSEVKEDMERGSGFPFDSLSIKEGTVYLEKILIEKALKHTKGNRTKAAKILEISHPTLLYKMKEYSVK